MRQTRKIHSGLLWSAFHTLLPSFSSPPALRLTGAWRGDEKPGLEGSVSALKSPGAGESTPASPPVRELSGEGPRGSGQSENSGKGLACLLDAQGGLSSAQGAGGQQAQEKRKSGPSPSDRARGNGPEAWSGESLIHGASPADALPIPGLPAGRCF